MIADRYVVNVEGAVVLDSRYLMVVRSMEEDHAPGALALPGGKVENASNQEQILEETLRREIEEETGVQVKPDMIYVQSHAFVADDGDEVIDVVFLCQYDSGDPTPGDPSEVASTEWLSASDVLALPGTPLWMHRMLGRIESRRLSVGW